MLWGGSRPALTDSLGWWEHPPSLLCRVGASCWLQEAAELLRGGCCDWELSAFISSNFTAVAGDYCVKRKRLGPSLRSAVKGKRPGTSLVVQWLRICLLMEEKWVRSLVQGDFTCRGWATKPGHLNSRSRCGLEPTLRDKRSHCGKSKHHS